MESQLALLPVELVESVAEYLSVSDFQAFRLTCKSLSLVTRPLLAGSHFVSLPWRNDIARLRFLSRQVDCASRIRSISLYFGQINEYKALHDSFSHHYLLEPKLRSDVLQDKWADYFRTKRLRQAAGSLDLTSLDDTLRSLPALRAAVCTWTQCPWERGSEPDRIFSGDVSIRLAKRRVPEVQGTFVEALAARGPDSLDDLTLEPLASTVPKGGMLSSLRRFRATLDRRSVPDVLEQLSAVLAGAPALTDLCLEYMNFTAVARPDAPFLRSIQLPQLRVLELIRPSLHLDGLNSFLRAHAETLDKLKIVAGRAISLIPDDDDSDNEEGEAGTASESVTTWEDVFAIIHDQLRLEEAYIAEAFVDTVHGRRIWFAHDIVTLGDTAMCPDGEWVTPANCLETYLVRKGPRPSLSWC